MILAQMLFDRRQDDFGAGTALVVLRDIHPQDRTVAVDQQGGGDGQCFLFVAWRCGMEQCVAQPEGIGHAEVVVRQHDCLNAMRIAPVLEFFDRVGAHGQDLNPAFIKLWPKGFESP